MAKITASVGHGGINRREDVITVQKLLNLNISQLTPLRMVDVKGICDSQTITLIREYQSRILKLALPDSRVDPNGRTLQKLSEAEPKGSITLTGLKLPTQAEKVLKEILASAGLTTAQVTSVSRTPAEQARIMYENCQKHGAAYNKNMYAAAGDKVIQVFEDNKTKPRETVIQLMLKKINEIGPNKISKHISDTHYTFDVAPSSIPTGSRAKFEQAIKSHKAVTKLIPPPTDPAFHIEIPKNSAYL
jgi:hypothetical protein